MWRSGYLMCPKCGSVYYAHMIKEQPFERSFEWYCPSYDCHGAVLFTIDELMIPAVKKLNELGYTTYFCCSGHNRNATLPPEYETLNDKPRWVEHGYIYFKHKPDTCPKGWYFDEDYPDTIRSECDSLAWSIQNLEDWVETLEPRTNSNSSNAT